MTTRDPDAGRAASLHRDDLAAILDEAWRLLARGAADPASPLRTPVLATVGLDGHPEARTVVLRAFDAVNRSLTFYTDARSPKVAELAADPRVSVVGYDPEAKVQLRLTGTATVAPGGEAAWDAVRAHSRLDYAQAFAPGTPVASPAIDALPSGFPNFRVVTVTPGALDWLSLSPAGHRRARFVWGEGGVSATWLAP